MTADRSLAAVRDAAAVGPHGTQ